MWRAASVFWLGMKELRSLFADRVLLALVLYAFSFAVYSEATGISHELRNGSVGIVDEDQSVLSRRISAALLRPYFKVPETIGLADVDRRLDRGRNSFVLDIPPGFEADLLAGRQPAIQVSIDATAVMQAGIGAGYLERIIADEITGFLGREAAEPVSLVIRMAFNPNLTTAWFTGVMSILNNVTMLGVLLAGAAVIREREHGTLDHLLVMPLGPLEITLAKVWANGLVITTAAGLSLWAIVHALLGAPIAAGIPLFLLATLLYLLFASALGLLLGTVARSMPQLGLLFMLLVLPMNLLSGGSTPFESMPRALQLVMMLVPSSQYVAAAQAVLYRGAGFGAVWVELAIVGVTGTTILAVAVLRLRVALARAMA